MRVPGSTAGSSSRLSDRVKSDNADILVDGDGGAEDLTLSSEGCSGFCGEGVGVWGSSPNFGSPRDVATGVAAGSCDIEMAFSGFTAPRVGGGGRPFQPLSDSSLIRCCPYICDLSRASGRIPSP